MQIEDYRSIYEEACAISDSKDLDAHIAKCRELMEGGDDIAAGVYVRTTALASDENRFWIEENRLKWRNIIRPLSGKMAKDQKPFRQICEIVTKLGEST